MSTTPSHLHPSCLGNDFKTGIIHLGLGAFHRAHQAVYTQRAMEISGGDWGIEAVSMRSTAICDALNAQAGRYALIERHGAKNDIHQISVIRRAHALSRGSQGILSLFEDLASTVVTLTVTEKGYDFDPQTRKLDWGATQIESDLETPENPKSVIGLLVRGLMRRRAVGGSGMTLLSCDNLTANGDLLRGLVLEFAAAVDKDLAEWTKAHCTFPNSMVDRITPASTDATFDLVERVTGQEDRAAVETEPFSQWVIEENFAGPMPDWKAAGAIYVSDVAGYEKMKLRMLNGAHTLIAMLGLTYNLPYVRSVMAHEKLADLVEKHMRTAASTLALLEGISTETYMHDLIERFKNPAIDHLCSQIASDTSQKLPQRIFEPVAELLATEGDVETYALTVAAWKKALVESDNLSDPLLKDLRAAARDGYRALAEVNGLNHFGVLQSEQFFTACDAAHHKHLT